jgi:hypothetical protein
LNFSQISLLETRKCEIKPSILVAQLFFADDSEKGSPEYEVENVPVQEKLE